MQYNWPLYIISFMMVVGACAGFVILASTIWEKKETER